MDYAEQLAQDYGLSGSDLRDAYGVIEAAGIELADQIIYAVPPLARYMDCSPQTVAGVMARCTSLSSGESVYQYLTGEVRWPVREAYAELYGLDSIDARDQATHAPLGITLGITGEYCDMRQPRTGFLARLRNAIRGGVPYH